MRPPTPTYSFTLPSISDNTPLDCRLYIPPGLHLDRRSQSHGTTTTNTNPNPKQHHHHHENNGDNESDDHTQQAPLPSSPSTYPQSKPSHPPLAPHCPPRPSAKAKAKQRAALLLHPYPPLGGSYDDPVILSLAQTLLSQDYIVGTFNFRGAGGSAGKATWKGKRECQDAEGVVGFLVYFASYLGLARLGGKEGREGSGEVRDGTDGPGEDDGGGVDVEMCLGGYSYGSLVLARLPAVESMLQKFEDAVLGSAEAEIVMRARVLAGKARESLLEDGQDRGVGSREGEEKGEKANGGMPRTHNRRTDRSSPVTIGGEESDVSGSERRTSREASRHHHQHDKGVEGLVRRSFEVPRRIKASVSKHSGRSKRGDGDEDGDGGPSMDARELSQDHVWGAGKPTGPRPPRVAVRYLIISPVLLPFTNVLCPPGPLVPAMGLWRKETMGSPGALFHQHPTLALFSSADVFTAAKRLRAWAANNAKESKMGNFEWSEIDNAGHFWGEPGAMAALQGKGKAWIRSLINAQ